MMTMTEEAGPEHRDPFAGYAGKLNGFDEMLDKDGELRPHWQAFANRFASISPAQQNDRAEKLRRLVRENGIAQDLFSESRRMADPWKIDLLPLIFSPSEWRSLEQAAIQRARLYELMLDDLYGEQNLLRQGKIPPQLILSDRTFLRPVGGTASTRGRMMFYAADMARDATGRWHILDGHAETVAGMGFALANRVVHSHITADLFRDCKALRLAPFFNSLHEELLKRAGRDDAVLALLTPGAHHEDYFGHAYLARYLGLLLVEGGDLRVVSNRVFMKTLEGLRPIDLVLRCIEAASADPLELNPNGFLGPAGFLQAIRKNPDLSVNSLGTAVIENRGLGPYLPALAQDLLGEDLAVWDTPRWWLGEATARQHVLENLENMIIRPVQEGPGRPGRARLGAVVSQLDEASQATLREKISTRGSAFVAEEKIAPSTTPAWSPDGLRPQPYAVRLFVARIDGEYHVMPGGIALDIDSGVAMHSPNGHSRDVWVSAEHEAPPFVSRLRLSLETPKISRGGTGLRSRIADNLFWLGRYVERADWIMRLLRGALTRLDPDAPEIPHQRVITKALNVLLTKDEKLLVMQNGNTPIDQLARALMSGRARSYGIIQTLDNVNYVASLIRDRLSLEAWRTLQTFQTSPIWRGEAEPGNMAEAVDYLDEGISQLASFNGMAAENMTRNYGWYFLQIGRRLERAVNLSELLLTLFADYHDETAESASLTFALEIADSTLTYRSRYLYAPVAPLVFDLLLVDETNPRSVGYQLAAISDHLDALPQAPEALPHTEERKLILDLMTRVKLADVYKLAEVGADKSRASLNTLFTQLAAELPELSEAITRRYFNLTENEMKRVYPRLGRQP